MKKFYNFSFTVLIMLVILTLTACSSFETKQVNTYPLHSKVVWSDSTGGSQPDTLRIQYPARHLAIPASVIDCTYSPVTIMLLSDSTGGSQPDTLFINNVVLKSKK